MRAAVVVAQRGHLRIVSIAYLQLRGNFKLRKNDDGLPHIAYIATGAVGQPQPQAVHK